MSFAHIVEIKEVCDVVEANRLIEVGAELLSIVPAGPVTTRRARCFTSVVRR